MSVASSSVMAATDSQGAWSRDWILTALPTRIHRGYANRTVPLLHEPAVISFNARLAAGGSRYKLPAPAPPELEGFLAVDGADVWAATS